MLSIDGIRPFGDRILVRPDPQVETIGSIVVPQTVKADNPNYYTMTGTVIRLGDGFREDVYECQNRQCGYQSRRTVGDYCPICKASQKLLYADSGLHAFDVAVGDRVVFGRFAGKQIEVDAGQPWGVPTPKYLVIREVEIIGVLSGDEQVLPGYQGAKMGKASSGVTADDGRSVVQVR